jgi:nucleotide-binding universal stress UspA family protein
MDEPFNNEIHTVMEENRPFTVIHPVHAQSELLVPFCHALSLVYASKGELEVIDVRRERERTENISIRKVLEQWGALPAGSEREDVGKLGIRIKKIVKKGGSKKEIAKRLRRHHHDILVIGLKVATGISRLFGQDLTDYLVQYFRQTTLYIPSGTKPFVDRNTGSVILKKIIMPVAETPSPELSFMMLRRLLAIFPDQTPKIVGIHMGEIFPYISAASLEGLLWEEILMRERALAQMIVSTAQKEDADLIIMSTNGRDTIQQKIIGSNTEQVLREAPCPVLAVAVD